MYIVGSIQQNKGLHVQYDNILLLTLSLKTIGPNTFRLISPDSPITPTLYVNERLTCLIPSRDT